MRMDGNTYIEQAIASGKETMRRHSNGIDYMFIVEDDGWIGIFKRSCAGWEPVIQACNIQKAEEKICLIEPVVVPMANLINHLED